MNIMLDVLKTEISSLPKAEQILLQTDGIHTDCAFHGNEEDFILPMHDIPHLNELMKYYGMARTRVMNMKPKSCYTWHCDPTPRIHIPIKVTDGSCMIVEDEVIRFVEGEAKMVDTTKLHTAVNPSREERTHVVGVLCNWQAPGIREILE